jgi:hypothetical protein
MIRSKPWIDRVQDGWVDPSDLRPQEGKAMPIEIVDLGDLVKAVREYNAAANSMRRAHEALMLLIPPGVTLLHHLPNDPSPYFWSYENTKSGLGQSAGDDETYRDRKCLIVEAPARREEFLPRLK